MATHGGRKENAAELVGLKLDLIVVAAGYGVIQVVKDATKTIPIVLVAKASTPSKAASLKASPVQEAISPASQTFPERLEENALSC